MSKLIVLVAFVLIGSTTADARAPLPTPGSGTIGYICIDPTATGRRASYCSLASCNSFNNDGDFQTRCDRGILIN